MNESSGSKILAALRSLQSAVEKSAVSGLVERLSDTGQRTFRQSHVHNIKTTLDRYVQGSAIVQWLTEEPDPDVIVIDLRESYILSPVISVLDTALLGWERITSHPLAICIGNWTRNSTLYAAALNSSVIGLFTLTESPDSSSDEQS
jgi:hypothetical protein